MLVGVAFGDGGPSVQIDEDIADLCAVRQRLGQGGCVVIVDGEKRAKETLVQRGTAKDEVRQIAWLGHRRLERRCRWCEDGSCIDRGFDEGCNGDNRVNAEVRGRRGGRRTGCEELNERDSDDESHGMKCHLDPSIDLMTSLYNLCRRTGLGSMCDPALYDHNSASLVASGFELTLRRRLSAGFVPQRFRLTGTALTIDAVNEV